VETVVVIMVIGAALFFTVRSFVRALRSRDGHCAGCAGCGQANHPCQIISGSKNNK
jgi:hypothetical protein